MPVFWTHGVENILKHLTKITSTLSLFHITYTVLLHLLDFLDFCLGKTSESDGKFRVAANQFESETVVQSLKCTTSNIQTETMAKNVVHRH